MKKNTFLILVFLIPFISISQLYTPGSGVTDIDGNTYQTIVINGQEWMAENLRTSTYSNGDPIPNLTDSMQWMNISTGVWCHFNNDSQYEDPYGKLYNWHTVSDPRNVCPLGWYVPSDAEWSTLINFLDLNADGGNNNNTAGGKMKSIGMEYWGSPNQDATNESGFSGLPGGRLGSSGTFCCIESSFGGVFGIWWSSTEDDSNQAWCFNLAYNNGKATRDGNNKTDGQSIRCIKNGTSSINEIKPFTKTLDKVFDILGNETSITPNELQFYLYNDGSVEKKIVMEK